MLSKQITYLRKKSEMSQSQLAGYLNVSPSTIGMYEQGRRVPDLDALLSLSRIFGVSLDYLITGEEAPQFCQTLHISPDAVFMEESNPATIQQQELLQKLHSYSAEEKERVCDLLSTILKML